MLVYKYLINNEAINILLIIFVNIAIIKLLFESSLKSAIYHGIILCILQYISEFLTLYLITLSLNAGSSATPSEHYEIGTIISRIIYFLLSRILAKFSVKESRSNSWGKWVMLSSLPIVSIFIILVIRNLTGTTLLKPFQYCICLIAICCLLVVNVAIYLIYEQAEKANQKLIELELENQKNSINMQYLKLLESKNETMSIMAHDYKNNVLTIANMSDMEDVKDYVQNMIGEITKYTKIAKTKNKLLDVILSKYTDVCESNDIKFEMDILNENLDFISGYDLSSLFNNILDNAVCAANESFNKYIYLEITNSLNSYHKIMLTNSCDDEPQSEKGKLLTTKKDKNPHGYGTKSIRKTINKYQGEMQWSYDKNQQQFKLIILFPNEQIE